MPASTTPYLLILDDVKALVRANITCLTCVERKVPELLEADLNSLPLCMIITTDRSNDVEAFEGIIIREYEVGIALVFESNQVVTANRTAMEARATLEKKLHVTSLTNATTVFDCDLDPAPIYDPGALAKNVDWSAFSLLYKSSESRN